MGEVIDLAEVRERRELEALPEELRRLDPDDEPPPPPPE